MVFVSHRCFRSKDISHHFIYMTKALFPWWFVCIFLSISKIWLVIVLMIGCKFRKILCIILSVSISIGCYVIRTRIYTRTNALRSCGYRCCLLIGVYLLVSVSFTLVLNLLKRLSVMKLSLIQSNFTYIFTIIWVLPKLAC